METILKDEFNRWAEAGRGERMERGHMPAVAQVLPLMAITPTSSVLDLGCGIGWATRLMARLCPQGRVVGVDISDQMVSRAAAVAENPSNVSFHVAAGDRLPFADSTFDRVLSVEVLYYAPDLPAVLREVARVTADGGKLYVLVDFYAENTGSHHWAAEIAVPMALLSTDEYLDHVRAAGFDNVSATRLLDPAPLASREAFLPTWGFSDWEQYKSYREAGSLLVTGVRRGRTPVVTE
jgi:SAM-dependent methyltransferase